MPNWAIYALASVMCWGISYSACGEAIKKIDRPSYVLLTCITSVLVYGIWGDLRGALSTLAIDRRTLFSFVIADTFGVFAAYLTYLAMHQKNATMVAALEITYPIPCALIAYFLLGQKIETQAISGIAIVVIGVILIISSEQ